MLTPSPPHPWFDLCYFWIFISHCVSNILPCLGIQFKFQSLVYWRRESLHERIETNDEEKSNKKVNLNCECRYLSVKPRLWIDGRVTWSSTPSKCKAWFTLIQQQEQKKRFFSRLENVSFLTDCLLGHSVHLTYIWTTTCSLVCVNGCFQILS